MTPSSTLECSDSLMNVCQRLLLASFTLSLICVDSVVFYYLSHSMYDFEDLPIAKSAFFKHDLKFLSHHSGVISTSQGCVSLSLGNYNPLSFTFKLLYGESCRDELGGKLCTLYLQYVLTELNCFAGSCTIGVVGHV